MDKREFAEYVQMRYEQNPNGRLDRFGKEFIQSDNFDITISKPGGGLTDGEAILGTSFGSTSDYGRRWNAVYHDETNKWSSDGTETEQDIIDEVRNRISRHPRQIDFYDKEEEAVFTGVVVVFTEDGYAIHPNPEHLVQL